MIEQTADGLGLTDEQLYAVAAAMQSASAAFLALTEALRPTMDEMLRAVNQFHAQLGAAHCMPRHVPETMMRKKLRKLRTP